jgi:hypothetical protein
MCTRSKQARSKFAHIVRRVKWNFHCCYNCLVSYAGASSAPAVKAPSKPTEKKEKAAPKKPAAAAAAAAGSEGEGPVGKLPTAKSAYMLFADDKRVQVKGESAWLLTRGNVV